MERGVGGGRENPWEILGNSGWGGGVWARTGSGWRLLLQLGRASSVPAGNASTALQWQLAYGGWIGYDWGLKSLSRLGTCCCCFSCCPPSKCHSGEILPTWDAGAMRCGDGPPRVAVSGV